MTPWMSVVVVCHNMRREVPRTLYSLSPAYQRGIDALRYEVLVVDSGSEEPLDREMVEGFGPAFSYFHFPTDSASPVAALNWGVGRSQGEMVALCIDGARILSPGLLKWIEVGARISQRPVIATLTWHLGEKIQRLAMLDGYDQEVEDRLLGTVDWRSDGYELFRISCLGGSSAGGWFRSIPESSCLALKRDMFEELGGYDARFAMPGGGYANMDFYKRACELPGAELVMLLGEGTFHQFHGGAATGSATRLSPEERFGHEYQSIRGAPYAPPLNRPVYLGQLPVQASPFLRLSAERA